MDFKYKVYRRKNSDDGWGIPVFQTNEGDRAYSRAQFFQKIGLEACVIEGTARYDAAGITLIEIVED